MAEISKLKLAENIFSNTIDIETKTNSVYWNEPIAEKIKEDGNYFICLSEKGDILAKINKDYVIAVIYSQDAL